MKKKGVNYKNEVIEDEWEYNKNHKPTEAEVREIVARVAEIGIRTIFENFCYRFGGKVFIQMKGGPIGVKVTMACARLVMINWGNMVKGSLKLASMEITLFACYVDNVRMGATSLRLGMRLELATMTGT